MKYKYFWWDLEESKFKGVLYDSIGMYFLHDHPYTCWEEFEAGAPHMAYAHLTYVRFEMLEQLFVDLRVILQMLGVHELPIKSKVKNINRHDWIKSIIDLKLLRFSSIRDVSFHFVNQILELGIDDYRLNIKHLKKAINKSHPDVIDGLIKINRSGIEIRNDRNERAHKGFCDLSTDDDQMFKSMSWAEESGSEIHNYDLEKVYMDSCNELYGLIVSETNEILSTVITVVDSLIDDYEAKYLEKKG